MLVLTVSVSVPGPVVTGLSLAARLPRFDLVVASERPDDRDWGWVELRDWCERGRPLAGPGRRGWAGEEGEVGLMALDSSLLRSCGSSAVLGREVLEIVLPSQNDLNIVRVVMKVDAVHTDTPSLEPPFFFFSLSLSFFLVVVGCCALD